MPQPHFGAQMPALITRNDGSQVGHVNPSTSEVVSEWNYLCVEEDQEYEKTQGKGQEKFKTEKSKVALEDA